MKFSTPGDPIIPGQEDELAPGVLGMAFDREMGIYIPFIAAREEGSGAISAFLDSLPTNKRVVFPNIINGKFKDMLARRGFKEGQELSPLGWVDIMERGTNGS